jgi:tetratricopeptide (TPR) repeat protein
MRISVWSFVLTLCAGVVLSTSSSAKKAGAKGKATDPKPAASGSAGPDDSSGAWLEKAAEQAILIGKYGRAVPLLRGLSALKPRDPSPIYRLGEVFTLSGQYEEAIAEYRRFAARPEADAARKTRAEAEAKRLEDAPAPFAESLFKPEAATEEAKRLFDQGKRSAQAGRYQSAIGELQASLLLDPDLPGPYRMLGGVYGKVGDRGQERLFLADYLRVRPDGPIADTVRIALKKENVLGNVTIDASFPCKIYVNGRETGKTTPLKGYTLPAGKYLIGLENEKYHTIGRIRVDVVAGKSADKKFNFGILSTKLDPWARIRVDGKDVGLWDEAGIPEGKHTVSYKSHDGSKEKTVEIEIKGGAREKLSW